MKKVCLIITFPVRICLYNLFHSLPLFILPPSLVIPRRSCRGEGGEAEMVKFSRELQAQLIPEWKDAFVDYRQLKKHVKKIKLSLLRSSFPSSSSSDDHHNGGGGFSLFDPVRAFAARFSAPRSDLPPVKSQNRSTQEFCCRSRNSLLSSPLSFPRFLVPFAFKRRLGWQKGGRE